MQPLSLSSYLVIVLIAFALGVWVCGESAKRLGEHDYGGIVWDEFVGFWITMMAAPTGWSWIVLGFVLFRLFDIIKPWPIKVADQQVQGGLGIMLDDVLAGIMAGFCLQLIIYLSTLL